MAEIPQFFVQRQLQRVPTAGQVGQLPEQPRLSVSDATAPARALGGVGEAAYGLSTALGKMAQAKALIDRQLREAQDTAKHAEALAQVLPKIAEAEDAVQHDPSIAPLDRAKAFQERLQPQIDELAKGLSKPAAAKFKLEMATQITSTQRQLRTAGRKEFVMSALTGLDTVMTQLADQELRATDPVARAGIQQSRLAILESYTRQGIISAEASSAYLHKSDEAVRLGQVQAMGRADPGSTYQAIQKHLRGEGTDIPQLAQLSPTTLNKLHDEMFALWRQQTEMASARDREAERRLTKSQGIRAGEWRGKMAVLDPTPENTPIFRAALETINKEFAQGYMNEEDHSSLTSTVRTMINKSLEPVPERDDPATEREVSWQIAVANSPDDLIRARETLLGRQAALRPETFRTLHQQIEERLTAGHLRDPQYLAGRDYLMQAAIVPGSILAGGAASLQEDTKRTLLLALTDYDDRMRELARTNTFEMRQRAMPLAKQLRELYFPPGPLEKLPFGIDEIETERELAEKFAHLRKNGIPEEQLIQYQRQWLQIARDRRAAQPPAPKTPGAGGTRP